LSNNVVNHANPQEAGARLLRDAQLGYILLCKGRAAIRGAEAQDDMIVNLNQYRKKQKRAAAETLATENRIRFGRTKGERNKEQRARERANKDIVDKRLD
jgi:Domain of unknown function (DUF4169)